MSEVNLRRAVHEDFAALGSLWKECFGDTEGFISAFFSALPTLGGGVVAEIDGCIAGAAYALTGQSVITPGNSHSRVGYIYGVGVAEKYRSHGIGRSATLAARELAYALGADIIATLPAEESLYAWYESILGVNHRLYRTKTELESRALADVAPISAEEYLTRREAILAARPHLCLSPASAEFENAMLREYGGGLYAVGECAIAAAYVENGKAVVRELLGKAEQETLCAYAAAVGAALNCPTAELWQACEKGQSYIAADSPLPSDFVWNLSFD